MIHLHLLEFQVLNRQRFDNERFLQDWFIFNGHRPMTRPIVLDTSDYLIGDPIPPAPNETGWKDTVRADPRRHPHRHPVGAPRASHRRRPTGPEPVSHGCQLPEQPGHVHQARATCGTATCSATRTTT